MKIKGLLSDKVHPNHNLILGTHIVLHTSPKVIQGHRMRSKPWLQPGIDAHPPPHRKAKIQIIPKIY